MEIILGLLLWIGLILAAVLVFVFGGKKYFSSVQGWEGKESSSAVIWGLIALVLAVAAFFFLPILSSAMFGAKFKSMGSDIANIAKHSGIRKFLSRLSGKIVAKSGRAIIAYAGVAFVGLVLLVWGIIQQIRENLSKSKDEYKREKLFSFRKDELDKINRK